MKINRQSKCLKYQVVIEQDKIKEELLNRLRNSDIISVSDRGLTTVTNESHTGTGTQKIFTLNNDGVKNIREVKIDSVVQTPIADYTYSLLTASTTNKQIVFEVAPTLSSNIEVSYDYGSGDKIYDDFPIGQVKEDKYPRIGFDIISESTELQSFDRVLYQSNLLISFFAYGIGKNQTMDLANQVRTFLISIREDLQRLRYIEPKARGKLTKHLPFDGVGRIFKQNCDFSAPFEFEEL